MVAIAAPPISQTKGHGRGKRNLESEVGGSMVPTSTYKRKHTVDG
jgi:hypothetical protein